MKKYSILLVLLIACSLNQDNVSVTQESNKGSEDSTTTSSTTTTVAPTTTTTSSTTTTVAPTTTTTLPEYIYDVVNVDNPPFWGTIFITGNIITENDPSTYLSKEYKGIDYRFMYDRRKASFSNIEAHIFDTYYSDDHYIEVQVNSEFTFEQAELESYKYAWLIGQLPKVLKRDIETVWIHKGVYGWGGGNNNILIHTGQTIEYENYSTGNIVEETLIHEAAHTSIDSYYYGTPEWNEQVKNDGYKYVSVYAKDFPNREDIAEMFPLYIAVRYFPDRISEDVKNKFLSTSINRVKYFDSQDLDFSIYTDN